MTIQLKEINLKVLVKEGRYQEKGKQYQQLDVREAKQFWSKIWQTREHNKKAEWISIMVKEFEAY